MRLFHIPRFMPKQSFFSSVSSHTLIIASAVFFIVFYNASFFTHLLEIYPLSLNSLPFLISTTICFTGTIIIFLALSCSQKTIKFILIALFFISSMTGYFMDTYHTVINDEMIHNVAKTDWHEVYDLFSLKLLAYMILLGLIPSLYVYRVNITHQAFWPFIYTRAKMILSVILTMSALIYSFSDYYSSFWREHKPVRYYANPSYTLYSSGIYLNSLFKMEAQASTLKTIGNDAKSLPHIDPRLVIIVVGETARADRFSLNGYEKQTNPLLSQENIFNFSNFWSCGTSTAYSVPCMFSLLNETNYSKEAANSMENALDVLKHAGVNVLWLDNNSDSKGVADRIEYQSYKSSDVNPVCDSECRDIGMLKNLQHYVDAHHAEDIVIVLHQMGNHGPAYYKRYPEAFEIFTPACKTNQLEECSPQALNNAYDNAILYTDYFLAETIQLLKANTQFASAMFYVSDHGESLGENGLYLHGIPNLIAPDSQRHVPAVLWLDEKMPANRLALAEQLQTRYTHDNLFHTILGLLNIQTNVYNPELDITK